MRFLCISDTHGLHRSLPYPLPEADGIIHAGDFTNRGTQAECEKALGWFNSLPYKYRIVIAGNHDLFMDPKHADEPSSESAIRAILPESEGFHYLWNSGCEIDGIKFWGSPEQPEFMGWGFNLPRGEPLRRHWASIPGDTDVLITHGPIYGVLDQCPDFSNPGQMVSVGDSRLGERIRAIKPSVHVCGHVHAGYGFSQEKHTLHINAAICTEKYAPANKPLLFDIDPKTKEADIVLTL